jgi:hypothetical protein
MSIVLGTNERLIIEDMPDSDLELEISMAVMASDGESVSTWLNEVEAKKLVDHLTLVFEI